MKEFVVDASTLVLATTVVSDEARQLRHQLLQSECHAPHHVDAEVGNVLRRQELGGQIEEEAATTALLAMKHLIDHRYPHVGPLSQAAWELRGAITFYDALYVALAAGLDVPLLTADARLSRAPKLPCKVEVVV
ncbi:type II toxin-antitoxin system VapC family toxin [Saccharopolyspora sp. NPDC050642]|uniref:type II toxin-antitoxin system VapC family toxin n=1 Tax=Saccharopolyspora sp. NPDC050642 TaxID=3157099 RepID=UPI0033E80785